MNKDRLFLVLSIIVFCFLSVGRAQQSPDEERQFSPSVSREFYDIAYQIAKNEQFGPNGVQQALIFLKATLELDDRAKYALPDMIKLATKYSEPDYSQIVRDLLNDYVDESADLEIAGKAVRYLLERLDSREEREELLQKLQMSVGKKNAALASEMNTLLGILSIEKSDNEVATYYFMTAYNINRYNKLAFEKLSELVGDQLKQSIYLGYLRLVLSENPLNIEAALAFAQYARQVQLYQIASEAYEYCADLFGYLYPNEDMLQTIYLPWAISCYNTNRNQYKCLQIAKKIGDKERYDLFLEGIAGKAALKIGRLEQAKQVFENAEEKIKQLLEGNENSENITAVQIAWFYCFAMPDAEKAIFWANKAYSSDPNSSESAAILAYALVINEQSELAKPIVENYEQNQISALALALIQLTEKKKAIALETLKKAITYDTGTLEAEKAKEILLQQGSDYVLPFDTEVILTEYQNNLGELAVPKFVSPDKIISLQINVRGSKFSYGKEFGGVLALTNNSSEPLVISNDGLFSGNIRVDAQVTGDIVKYIPMLVSMAIRPSSPIGPGKNILVPLRLFSGELRKILFAYPQASLDIEFTAYIDPVLFREGGKSKILNRITDIEPVKVSVKRPGVELSTEYLQNRFASFRRGRQGQKISAATLFSGLLMEQTALANRQPPYQFMYEDWMPEMLKSSLKHNLGDNDWIVKAHTMAAMLSLPLDYGLISEVSANLSDVHWPVRLITIYLLAQNSNSNPGKILNWTAKYDSNALVREMAIALGGAKPQEPKQPSSQNSSSK